MKLKFGIQVEVLWVKCSEDGGNKVLRNVGILLQPRRPQFKSLLP